MFMLISRRRRRRAGRMGQDCYKTTLLLFPMNNLLVLSVPSFEVHSKYHIPNSEIFKTVRKERDS